MKFTYQYRTGDNVLHNGTVCASDRDAAFSKLRARGIKPSRLEDAPGFFNKLFGKGKRWIAIGILAFLVAALALALNKTTRPIIVGDVNGESSQRHQIYGDPAIMDAMLSDGFSNIFSNIGERYLAAYAMPGSSVSQTVRLKAPDELLTCLTNKIDFLPTDSREVAELKAIVNGLKDELREYLSDGKGTAVSFMRRLDERQEEERLIYLRVKNELEENPNPDLWEERNRSLREMGIRTIPRPRK